ncbi:hypothetical protein [Lysinibacillus fusiformis]
MRKLTDPEIGWPWKDEHAEQLHVFFSKRSHGQKGFITITIMARYAH